jgi:hypothetical protein
VIHAIECCIHYLANELAIAKRCIVEIHTPYFAAVEYAAVEMRAGKHAASEVASSKLTVRERTATRSKRHISEVEGVKAALLELATEEVQVTRFPFLKHAAFEGAVDEIRITEVSAREVSFNKGLIGKPR